MSRRAATERLTYSLVDSLFAISGATMAQVSELMGTLGLTTALADALWQLDPEQPAPSMRELAVRLRCDPSTLTFVADRLAKKQLLKREVEPGNRRIKRLVLTAKGAAVRAKLTAAMTRSSPLARLSPAEQRQLLALLTRARALVPRPRR
ncbi:MAG: MarR family transcriptional regulator [Myxococcaceae bacterium]|nr:MarR family transcriptional regulator [Myxococcaceae bacterium]